MLHKDGSLPQEKRMALDVLAVRESLERPGDHLRWVPTRHMLADIFTKSMKEPEYFEKVLKTGKLSLVESAEADELAS